MKLARLLDKRLLWIAAVVILVVLMMDFSQRMSEMLRLKEDQGSISLQVTARVETQAALQTQIAYATSDVAVEEWARQEGRMVRDGESPIVPVPPGGATPVPEETPLPTPVPVENWQVWQTLFFDQAPSP